jgi:hypothetical protein
MLAIIFSSYKEKFVYACDIIDDNFWGLDWTEVHWEKLALLEMYKSMKSKPLLREKYIVFNTFTLFHFNMFSHIDKILESGEISLKDLYLDFQKHLGVHSIFDNKTVMKYFEKLTVDEKKIFQPTLDECKRKNLIAKENLKKHIKINTLVEDHICLKKFASHATTHENSYFSNEIKEVLESNSITLEDFRYWLKNL